VEVGFDERWRHQAAVRISVVRRVERARVTLTRLHDAVDDAVADFHVHAVTVECSCVCHDVVRHRFQLTVVGYICTDGRRSNSKVHWR